MADDIRIYNSKKSLEDFAANLSTDIEVLNTLRLNGDLLRAKELGKRLATLTPRLDGENDGVLSVDFKKLLAPKFNSQDILFQIRVLMIFAAESLLQLEITAPQLSTTAINAMHDSLRKESPAFYKNISDGAAFTFYYLALKKGGSLESDIGEAFAMLCSVRKDNESFVEAGRIIWKESAAVIENEIKNAQLSA